MEHLPGGGEEEEEGENEEGEGGGLESKMGCVGGGRNLLR